MKDFTKTAIFLLCLGVCLRGLNSQCTSYPETVDYMETGEVQLGSPSTSLANEDYTFPFSSGSSLGSYANIFHAFAITGLQTPSGQSYYSIMVDRVYLLNSNSRFRIVMNYYNDGNSVKTQFNKVKLSYIFVSPQFEGIRTSPNYAGNSYVWAHSVEFTPSKTAEPVDNSNLFRHANNGANVCGFIDSSPAKFGTNCPSDAKVLYHYYIMGFRYDSRTDSAYEFRVQVLGSSTDETDFDATFGATSSPNGPQMTVSSMSNRLDKIKVGIVITVLRDYNTYPRQPNNPQNFQYSGIYMPVTNFNSANRITSSSNRNQNYFDIGFSNHKMFGFSSLYLSDSNSPIQFNLDLIDLYSVRIDTSNSMSNVRVSGDIFTKGSGINFGSGGSSCSSARTIRTQVRREIYSSVPSLSTDQQTITKLSSSDGIIPDTSSEYVFQIRAYNTGNTGSVTYTMQITYENLNAGRVYQISTAFDELGATNLPNSLDVRYSVQVDGASVFTSQINMNNNENDIVNKIGRTINSRTSIIKIMVAFRRSSSQDITFHMNLALFEIESVFNPSQQCCASTCPSSSGINLNTDPVTCVSCNSTTGQYYDSDTDQCKCQSGNYLISSVSQTCSPCTGQLCAQCQPSTPHYCLRCVVGAQLNAFFGTCNCSSGSLLNNGSCSSCDYRCDGCSLSGQCSSCIDPARRDIANKCACINRYYDDGTPYCKLCSSSCLTCAGSSTNCTSCHSTNTTLTNGKCQCRSGHYLSTESSSFGSCLPCNPVCDSCTGSAENCSVCSPAQNKVPGYDSQGRRTCICKAGHFLDTRDGSCIQSDCASDPYCAQCSSPLSGPRVCLSCKSSVNRVLSPGSQKCICQDGYYESARVCISCPQACATCTNSSLCTSCVSGASRKGNTCTCSTGMTFMTSPTRHCTTCVANCAVCNLSGASCAVCETGYTKTLDGKCICALNNFVNVSTGNCVSCPFTNCQQCNSAGSECVTCQSGSYLQNGRCISSCQSGYYMEYTSRQCRPCSSGCQYCSTSVNCLVCQPGKNLYNGQCFVNCPAGTVAQTSQGNCTACNAPCRTCTVHPSRCTSCQGSAVLTDFGCQRSCPIGSFSLNGRCEYCDFECASCLGSARTCTACPSGRYLFNGNCILNCPRPLINGQCPTSCPAGFYQGSASSCIRCPSNCAQCSGSTQCTVCAQGLYTGLQGQCVYSCPSGYYPDQNRNCIYDQYPLPQPQPQPSQCYVSNCLRCPTNSAYMCQTCIQGYTINARGQCEQQSQNYCLYNQYRSPYTNQCMNCNSTCDSCQSQNYCTTCANSNRPPINGQCTGGGGYPYPPSSCPSGYVSVNGVCQQCSANCRECTNNYRTCTSCNAGLTLNYSNSICYNASNQNGNGGQPLPILICQQGQYSQNYQCKRRCPAPAVYQNGICYQQCLQGFRENGYGGCVSYYQGQGGQGSCPSGQYRDYSGICRGCSYGCISCISATLCTSCQSGYTLNTPSTRISGSISSGNNNNVDCVPTYYPH